MVTKDPWQDSNHHQTLPSALTEKVKSGLREKEEAQAPQAQHAENYGKLTGIWILTSKP